MVGLLHGDRRDAGQRDRNVANGGLLADAELRAGLAAARYSPGTAQAADSGVR